MLIIAHRGHRKGPENSISAILLAKKHHDIYDGVEFDVRSSKDGKFFLLHDKTLHRTTSMNGLISGKHSNELSRCVLANGERLPSLDKALSSLRGYRKPVFLEMKSPGNEKDLAKLLKKHRIKNLILDTTFDSMRIFRKLNPRMRFHYDALFLTKREVRKAKGLGCYSVGSPVWSLRKGVVEEAKRLKVLIMPYNILTKRLLDRAKNLKVDGIFADKYY
jgi:glycerophosphoryl diester phosphodiesterase